MCIFGSHTFVPISRMCKRQTSASHSSTESEVILGMLVCEWMESLLDLWDAVTEVLHSSKNTDQVVRDHCRKEKVDYQMPRSRARSEIRCTNPHTKLKRNSNRRVDELSNVEHVVTSAKLSQFVHFLKTMRL